MLRRSLRKRNKIPSSLNDIIAIDSVRKKGFVTDPTVRFEHESQQAQDVDAEKKRMYEPCLLYRADKYRLVYGELAWEVIELFSGARGIVSKFVVDFWKRFDLNMCALVDVAQDILSYSVHLISSHIYSA